jgi:hypothetical protein
MRPDLAVLHATDHDEAAAVLEGHQITFTPAGVRLRPWQLHYRSPDDLDRAARAVGLVLTARWADWDGTPFTTGAPHHVSRWTSTGAGP